MDLGPVGLAVICGLVFELGTRGLINVGRVKALAGLSLDRLASWERTTPQFQLRLPGLEHTEEGTAPDLRGQSESPFHSSRKGGVNDVQSP